MRTVSLTPVMICALLLLVSGVSAAGSATLTISGTVVAPGGPIAEFAGSPTSGFAPLTVRFSDYSSGTPTAWAWELDGNGFVDSNVKNPSFVYHRAGKYTVTLTVVNAAGADSATKPGYVTVSEAGALARVRSLQRYMAAMHADGLVKWFLSRHLEIAELQISRGNGRAAAAQVTVFLQRVSLFERFRLITAGDAAYLREEAQIILALIPR